MYTLQYSDLTKEADKRQANKDGSDASANFHRLMPRAPVGAGTPRPRRAGKEGRKEGKPSQLCVHGNQRIIPFAMDKSVSFLKR
jgi:hypothetical protein